MFEFPKSSRLSGKKSIDNLFATAKSGFCYPFRYLWINEKSEDDEQATAILISVPKRQLKRAVWRNTIKRRTREAFRLNHRKLLTVPEGTKTNIALIYCTREIHNYKKIEESVKRILEQIGKSR